MKTVLVNYATGPFAGYRALLTLTGQRAGCDDCLEFGPQDLDAEFRRRHRETLAARRGAGYFLWKPYILVRALQRVAPGDVLFYCDAGIHCVRPIQPLLDLLEGGSSDLVILDGGFRESQYTKRDAFLLMGCDSSEFVETPQSFAGAFLLRKTEWAERFAREFLAYACDDRVLTDRANVLGEDDYPDFIEHRHDQSILSLLAKRYGISFTPNPFLGQGLVERTGPRILNHTRQAYPLKDVVLYLLARGALRIEDLPSLERAVGHE